MMRLKPRIVTLPDKKLVGTSITMSLASNKTTEVWKAFMPLRKEINNKVSDNLFSLALYMQSHFADFKPNYEFVKWAAIEVASFENVPIGLELFTLKGGLYAVFDYKGSSANTSVFQYIFGTWLPNSEYFLDHRPHFEILGEKYKNNDPESEEEIWIPVRKEGPQLP